jgi:hypothetical protein
MATRWNLAVALALTLAACNTATRVESTGTGEVVLVLDKAPT